MTRAIEWLNDFADGLGYGALMAIIAFAGLMPRATLQAVEAMAMLVMP